jgi:hypothetical protein
MRGGALVYAIELDAQPIAKAKPGPNRPGIIRAGNNLAPAQNIILIPRPQRIHTAQAKIDIRASNGLSMGAKRRQHHRRGGKPGTKAHKKILLLRKIVRFQAIFPKKQPHAARHGNNLLNYYKKLGLPARHKKSAARSREGRRFS